MSRNILVSALILGVFGFIGATLVAVTVRMKAPLLETLGPDTVAAAVEIQHLQLRCPAIDEDEQLTTQRVFQQPSPD